MKIHKIFTTTLSGSASSFEVNQKGINCKKKYTMTSLKVNLRLDSSSFAIKECRTLIGLQEKLTSFIKILQYFS